MRRLLLALWLVLWSVPCVAQTTLNVDLMLVNWGPNAQHPEWPLRFTTVAQQQADMANYAQILSVASFGRLTVVTTVHDFVTLPNATCVPNTINTLAGPMVEARDGPVTGKRIYLLQNTSSCGNLSGLDSSPMLLVGSNGSFTHEVGHFVGMTHSFTWSCVGGYASTGGSCTTHPVDDDLSMMGTCAGCQPDPGNKILAGWLVPEQITLVTGTGIYHVDPYENANPGIKVLKIAWMYPNVGFPANYYLEYHKAPTGPAAYGVVRLHYEQGLLDVDPIGPAEIHNLDVGKSTVLEMGIVVTTVSQDPILGANLKFTWPGDVVTPTPATAFQLFRTPTPASALTVVPQ